MSKFSGKVLFTTLLLTTCSAGLLHGAESRTPTPEEFRELVKQHQQSGPPVQRQGSRPAPAYQPLAVEQYNRALSLQTKKGASPKELKESAALYRSAGDGGITQAYTNLALLYLEGKGVKKDVKKALSILDSASKKNDIQADITLARIYLSGKDVKMDEKKGVMYLNRAAKSGNQAAVKMLADYNEWKKKNALSMKQYEEIIKKAQLSQGKPRTVSFPPQSPRQPSLKELLNPEPVGKTLPVIPGQDYFKTPFPPAVKVNLQQPAKVAGEEIR